MRPPPPLLIAAMLASLGPAEGCSKKPGKAPLPPPPPPAQGPATGAAPTTPIETMSVGPKVGIPDKSRASGELGGRDNPICCLGEAGEKAYLQRLICPDGSAPTFRPYGRIGRGPYGNDVDLYDVFCGTTKHRIFMDPYFKDYIEDEAPPGFTIAK